jgi:hypothetical protein
MAAELDRCSTLQRLTELEVDYWHDVDFNWGRTAHTRYLEDGTFIIGDIRMEGREAISQFYGWREGRGDRVARHVVSNFRLEQSTENSATLRCILLLYAADGRPVLPSQPAILIADVLSECLRCADGQFRFRSHVLLPIFMSGEAPTLPQPQAWENKTAAGSYFETDPAMICQRPSCLSQTRMNVSVPDQRPQEVRRSTEGMDHRKMF